jgi:hypothetical protein
VRGLGGPGPLLLQDIDEYGYALYLRRQEQPG